ncbi:Methyltransferase-like protein 16 [Balamuthia mandrillaris]
MQFEEDRRGSGLVRREVARQERQREKRKRHHQKASFAGGGFKRKRYYEGGDEAEDDEPRRFGSAAAENNKKMHPENYYRTNKPDFVELAKLYPSFKAHVHITSKGQPNIRWTDPEAVRELTCVLLRHDFQIAVELPLDQLCPAVPNRVNYIHWLSDLLKHSPDVTSAPTITGIDIGTGASCIYPLLGVRLKGWRFVATEIDPISLDYARRNIAANQWEDLIELRESKSGHILQGIVKENESFAFCMCNPPFFSDQDHAPPNPKTACRATENERLTTGGEFQFIKQMIQDSLRYRNRIRWYTSMLGRKVDVKLLEKELVASGIVNIRTTTFYQGKTARWGIAWTFSQDGLEDLLKEKLGSKRGKADEQTFAVQTGTPDKLFTLITQVLEEANISQLHTDMKTFTLSGQVHNYSWKNSFLQQLEREAEKEKGKEDEERGSGDGEEEAVAEGGIGELRQQYEQVKAALEGFDGSKEEEEQLLQVKAELEELLQLQEQLVQLQEEEEREQKEEEENHEEKEKEEETTVIGPSLPPAKMKELQQRQQKNEEREEDNTTTETQKPIFGFNVAVYQAQSHLYMVNFSLQKKQQYEGQEEERKKLEMVHAQFLFHDLVDHIRSKVTDTFKLA